MHNRGAKAIVTALSVECLNSKGFCRYTDRLRGHDSDSQGPPRSTGHHSNPIQSPPNGQTEWKWGMTINAIRGLLRQQGHCKGQACHRKGVTRVEGHRDNQQSHHPGSTQHIDVSVAIPPLGHCYFRYDRTFLSSSATNLLPWLVDCS